MNEEQYDDPTNPISLRAEQRRAEIEQRRQIRASYASDRRPWLERITFTFALIASILVALRPFCSALPIFRDHGHLLTAFYWLALVIFAGDFNLSRLMDRLVAQERAWQLLLIILLPISARIIAIIIAVIFTR